MFCSAVASQIVDPEIIRHDQDDVGEGLGATGRGGLRACVPMESQSTECEEGYGQNDRSNKKRARDCKPLAKEVLAAKGEGVHHEIGAKQGGSPNTELWIATYSTRRRTSTGTGTAPEGQHYQAGK